jgi:excisionase family DNA binding protein
MSFWVGKRNVGRMRLIEMKSELEAQDIQTFITVVAQILEPVISHIQKQENNDALLTVDEAAHFLKISKQQIYQWVNDTKHGIRDFPFLKMGKLLRFSKRELLIWMKNNC